jgi:hypothetical protein
MSKVNGEFTGIPRVKGGKLPGFRNVQRSLATRERFLPAAWQRTTIRRREQRRGNVGIVQTLTMSC